MITKDWFTNLEKDNFIFEISKKFLNYFGGSIVEIGAGEGISTFNFLKICEELNNKSNKNSKVIVIDPFEEGWDDMPPTYGTPYPFSQFEQNVKSCKENLHLIKKSSQDKSVYDDLYNFKPITFGFIDGLQYKEAVINDLILLDSLDCKIICLDDSTRMTEFSQVPLAIEYFLSKYNDYDVYDDKKSIRGKAFLIKKHLYNE